jgi:hypothetical protein
VSYFEYRSPAGGCKHVKRCAFAPGERSIPAAADRDAGDGQLGMHINTTPRVAATDGGQALTPNVAERVTDEEIYAREADNVDTDETDGRPNDRDCTD